MEDILEKIIATKRQELLDRKAEKPYEQILAGAKACTRNKISFRDALLGSPSGIIAEFKRKSPSKGYIKAGAQPGEIIPGYADAGAAAVSVLTDEPYFGGRLDDLSTARKLVSIPLLRKDFIIDPYQICEARLSGADVILLIAAALTPGQVAELSQTAHDLQLEVLLEIHNEKELGHLCETIDVVGINNRNLSTFITDIRHSLELGEKIPGHYIKISESGISSPDTVRKLKRAGFRGFLMGENFMKEEKPAQALEKFISEL